MVSGGAARAACMLWSLIVYKAIIVCITVLRLSIHCCVYGRGIAMLPFMDSMAHLGSGRHHMLPKALLSVGDLALAVHQLQTDVL